MKKLITSALTFAFIFGVYSQISMAPYVNTPTGSWLKQVKIADMNNDGRNDIVAGLATYGDPSNDYKIKIYYQSTTGTYGSPQSFSYESTYPGLRTMDVGDINSDNKPDVVIGVGNNVGVLTQTNTGTFSYQPYLSGNDVDAVAIGDLNSDGKNDIVCSHWNSPFIKVMYQTATGFNVTAYSVNNAGYDDIRIADVTGDGKNDVVYMHGQMLAPYIYVFSQLSNGLLSSPSTINLPVSGAPRAVTFGDINNDGKTDMAISHGGNLPDARILIYTQQSGSLQYNSTLPTYQVPGDLKIKDLNCDGVNDLVVTHCGWLKVSIYTNSKTQPGVFGNYQLFTIPYASWYFPGTLDLGDINSDSRVDIVIADYNSGVVRLLNTTQTTHIIKDTTSSVRLNRDTITTSVSSSLQNQWIEVHGYYKVHYRDSLYKANKLINQKRCFDTTIITKTTQCSGSSIDTVYKTKCVDSSYWFLSETRKVFSDSVLINGCPILVYPNPTSNKVMVNGLAPGDNVFLYQSDGKLVGKYISPGSVCEITLRNYPSGIYIIRTGFCSKKVLKE